MQLNAAQSAHSIHIRLTFIVTTRYYNNTHRRLISRFKVNFESAAFAAATVRKLIIMMSLSPLSALLANQFAP